LDKLLCLFAFWLSNRQHKADETTFCVFGSVLRILVHACRLYIFNEIRRQKFDLELAAYEFLFYCRITVDIAHTTI
jgi:hypothetical protein